MVKREGKRPHAIVDNSSGDEQAVIAAREEAKAERRASKKRKVQKESANSEVEVVKDEPQTEEKVEVKTADIAPAKQDKNQGGLIDVFQKLLTSTSKADENLILAKDKRAERKLEEEKKDAKKKSVASVEKKILLEKGHIIPDHSTKNYEKSLSKLATSGVVKLFNAVRKQQKVLDEELDGVTLEAKKEKVVSQVMTKGGFLDILKKTPIPSMSSTSAATASVKVEAEGSQGGKAKGSWLSSGYMMGAKMKDWDKEGAEEEEEEEVDEEEMNFDEEDDE